MTVPPDETAPLHTEVGPLDADTLRPARSLLLAKALATVLVFGVVIVFAVALFPQIATGVGLAHQEQATVSAVAPLHADAADDGERCRQYRVNVRWATGSGGFGVCAERAADSGPDAVAYQVGDVVTVHTVSGWDNVVVGGYGPNLVIVLLGIGVISLCAAASARFWAQLRALRKIARGPAELPEFAATQRGRALAMDVLAFGRGKRATLRLEFDDDTWLPLRAHLSGVTPRSLEWTRVTVFPLRRTRSGRPAGPYVLRTERGSVVATGAPMKTAR